MVASSATACVLPPGVPALCSLQLPHRCSFRPRVVGVLADPSGHLPATMQPAFVVSCTCVAAAVAWLLRHSNQSSIDAIRMLQDDRHAAPSITLLPHPLAPFRVLADSAAAVQVGLDIIVSDCCVHFSKLSCAGPAAACAPCAVSGQQHRMTHGAQSALAHCKQSPTAPNVLSWTPMRTMVGPHAQIERPPVEVKECSGMASEHHHGPTAAHRPCRLCAPPHAPSQPPKTQPSRDPLAALPQRAASPLHCLPGLTGQHGKPRFPRTKLHLQPIGKGAPSGPPPSPAQPSPPHHS